MHDGPQQPEREEDRELVRKAVQGDEDAFGALVRRKRERIFWIAYRIVGNEEDAREIAQTTFIRLWKAIGKYDPRQSFDTWLYRITVNLAIDHYRSRGPVKTFEPLEEGERMRLDAQAPGPIASDPLAALTGSELRAIFVLSQIEGMPTEEIARVMGISHSTVRNHLFQARRSLQEAIRLLYPEYYRSGKGRGEPPRQ